MFNFFIIFFLLYYHYMVNKDVYKIVRTHARNVHREHGQKRLDDDASRVSLGPGKRRCCVLDALGRRLVETQKKLVLEQLRVSGSGL